MQYTRQLARGKITEAIYDALIEELEDTEKELREQLDDLITMRDDAQKVDNSIEYVKRLLERIQERLPKINQSEEELLAMSEEEKDIILQERQRIVRALCDKVHIFADGDIEIEGIIEPDGKQFDLPVT